MDGFLKQSTASQTRWIGPFVDDSDFKTAETGLTIANTDIKVSKNGGASASKNSGGGTHDTNGMYAVTWDATDTATVGELKYSVKVAGALQVFGSYVVVEEEVYDDLFAASAVGYLKPTTAGRDLDVSAGGEAGVDWANIGSPTTAVNLSGTSTKALEPTTAGRTLDVSAGGEAGLDWANIGSPTTTVGLSGTTVKTATDVETDTQDIQTRLPAALTAGGNMKADALALSGDTVAADNAESFFDGTGYAGTNNVIPTVTTTTNLTTNNDKTGYRLSSTGVDDILRTALTEAYAADGAAGTLSQILFGIQAFLQERSVSGTTLTVKKLDGSTTAMTFTLSDATSPTSVTRAS